MKHKKIHANLRDIILGGQDGLVNVLGVILGVGAATSDIRIVIISGLAATFAESISMAAVAYTSTEAEVNQYESEVEAERRRIEENPQGETQDVRIAFEKLGFEGELLDNATSKITSNKEAWTKFMIHEELKLSSESNENPLSAALVVGIASLVGSIVPLLPFFFVQTVRIASAISIFFCALLLFAAGFTKAKETIGNPLKSGIKMLVIGIVSALAGYLVGVILAGLHF